MKDAAEPKEAVAKKRSSVRHYSQDVMVCCNVFTSSAFFMLDLSTCRACKEHFDAKCLGPGRQRAQERLEKAWGREMRRFR